MKKWIVLLCVLTGILLITSYITLQDKPKEKNIFIFNKEVKTYLYEGNSNGILYIPGGNGVFGTNHQKIVETLNSIGFTVLAIDYSELESLDNKEEAEIIGISQSISNFPDKTEKIILFGSSHGAWIALNILENKYNSFNRKIISGIDVSGPTDIKSLCAYREENKINNGIASECDQSTEETLRSFSPLFFAEKIQVPILILHSLNDQSVPAIQSQNLAKEMNKSNKEFTMKVYPGSKHGAELIPTAKEDIINFLNKAIS